MFLVGFNVSRRFSDFLVLIEIDLKKMVSKQDLDFDKSIQTRFRLRFSSGKAIPRGVILLGDSGNKERWRRLCARSFSRNLYRDQAKLFCKRIRWLCAWRSNGY